MKQKIYLSWEAIEQKIRSFAEQIKDPSKLHIVTVWRGGVIPAIMLQHFLGNKQIKTSIANFQSYDGASKKVEWIWKNETLENETVCFVDDIIDTGNTRNKVLSSLGKKCSLEFYCYDNFTNKNPNVWIVFPWESDL
jgi:hypoxanthine phosphoribosyltransferase